MYLLKKPKLLPRHKQERVSWANRYSQWDQEWFQCIFADESSVEYDKQYDKYIWRRKGESLKEGFFVPTRPKFGKKYVKVFSFISEQGVGPLVFVEDVGKWNRFTYKAILEENLLDFIEENRNRNYSFIDDGDSTHNSDEVTDFYTDNNIRRIRLPPCSSDFNPIEVNIDLHVALLVLHEEKSSKQSLQQHARIQKRDFGKLEGNPSRDL